VGYSIKGYKALRECYQENEVWNKGRPWPTEIRDRIREGCLNSEVGMGPKSEPVQEEEEEQEVII
jgi:hypothetical protein